VVLTTFNVATMWNETFSSLVTQNYRGVLHIVIVDDDSTDGTSHMVVAAARTHKHTYAFIIPTHSQGGVATPLSLGIAYCKQLQAKYIANMDGDDLMESGILAEMVDIAERTKVEMVLTGYDVVSADLKTKFKKSSTEQFAQLHAPMPRIRLNMSQHINWYAYTLPAPWRKLLLASHAHRLEKRCLLDGDHLYEDNFMHWCLGVATRTFSWLDRSALRHRMSRTLSTTPAIARGGFLHNFERLATAPWMTNMWRPHLVRYIQSYKWIATQQPTTKWRNKTLRILDALTRRATSATSASSLVPPNGTRHRYYLSIVTPCHSNKFSDIRAFRSIARVMHTLSWGSVEAIIVAGALASSTTTPCERSGDALSREFAHVYYASVPGVTAGRMRNLAIPFVEGLYTLFVDADDVIISAQVPPILAFAKRSGADVVVFPYTTCHMDRNRTCTGMIKSDHQLYTASQRTTNSTRTQALAMRLVNYPWNRLVRTVHMHTHSTFFGTTTVHNDVNYHWGAIATAQSVVFVSQTNAMVQHWMHSQSQLTRLRTNTRLQNHMAIAFTHRHLLRHISGFCRSPASRLWSKSVRNLLGWGRSRIPNQYNEVYKQNARVMVKCIEKCKTSCFNLRVYQAGDLAFVR